MRIETPEEPAIRSRTDAPIKLILDAADILVIFAALVLSYWLRFHAGPAMLPAVFRVSKGIPAIGPYLQAYALVSLVWFGMLLGSGVHARRGPYSFEQAFEVVRILTIGAGLMMMGMFLVRGFEFSRLTVFLGLLLAPVSLCGWHALKSRLLAAAARGASTERVVIVGDGELARDCAKQIAAAPVPLVTLVGYAGKRDGLLDGVLPELGGDDTILDVVREQEVDRVLIALPSAESDRILGLIRKLDETSVQITLLPDLFAMLARSVETTDLFAMPTVTLGRLPIHGFPGQIKHFLDFWLALIGLIVLSPLFAVVALLIKLTSPGPVFYVQERVGLDGRPFRMIKFRSMRVDAEDQTGPVWATKDDPRRTWFGTLLRKFSIDELPQLVNVIRGEMSLVGPRPERQTFVDKFKVKPDLPRYMHRHKVRAGITGLAQVSGQRGDSDIKDRTDFDIQYIESWSLWLDFKILVKTFWVAFVRPTGA